MSSPRIDGWSGTLHELWAAAMAAPDRLELGSRLLGVLLGLPGAVAAAGLEQDPKGRTERLRWVTPGGRERPSFDLERLVARRLEPVLVRRIDGCVVAVAGFAGASGAVTNLCVVFGGPVPAAALAAYFARIVEVGLRAIERLDRQSRLEEAQGRDALLAEASLQMDAVLDVARTGYGVARMVVPAVAEGCLVYLVDGTAVTLAVGVHVDARRRWPGQVSGRHLGWLHDLVVRALADPSGPAADLRELSPVQAGALGARSLRVTVLRVRGRLLGAVVFLFDRPGDRIPGPSFLLDLTRRAALALDNAELYEQRRRDVVTLQKHLLPAVLQTAPGVQTAASYAVADKTLEVGGDFYDVVPRADGGCAAMIGDVCGRGVGAAAMTGMARHTLSTLLHEGMSGERALARLNEVLCHDGSWRFVTGAVITLSPEPDGGFAVQLASAGHPAPLVIRAGGDVVTARGGGVVLGVRNPARIGSSLLHLAPGDTLLLFTDGLTESRDAGGVMFEDSGLLPALAGAPDEPLDVLVERLNRLAAAFSQGGADDIAVLGLRATR
ncbi:PP2C family protein-serine/threonine phosphatase [Actinoplanes sp. NPDC051494]|uniref:PP2C family protein-serine/threonine phosphatase n=1 Tax=Actinoplanes sp. NPDC051494 TaxID=3363907 RepID=UPI0037A2E06D